MRLLPRLVPRLLPRLLLLTSVLATVLIAGLAGAGAWHLSQTPPEALAAEVEAQFAAAGIPVRIDAAAAPKLAFWPWPGLRVGAVRSGGDGDAESLRLSAHSALLGVSPRHLLAGRLTLGRIVLHGAALELTDPRLPGPFSLRDAQLVLASGPDGSLSLSGEGMLAGRPVGIAAEIADPVALADARPTGAVVELSSAGDLLRFEGAAALAPTLPLPVFDGTMSVAIADPAEVARWLTGAVPPPGLAALAAVQSDGTLESGPDRLLLRLRGSGDANGRSVGIAATVRGAEDWMQTGQGSAEVTLRAGGLFSANWAGVFATDAVEGWRASGPVTAAVLDGAALRRWWALDLPGMPEQGAARLAGELAASPGALTLDPAELHRDGGTPVAGALAYAVGTGAVRGGFGPGVALETPVTVAPQRASATALDAPAAKVPGTVPGPADSPSAEQSAASPAQVPGGAPAPVVTDPTAEPAPAAGQADATAARPAPVEPVDAANETMRGAPLPPGAEPPPGPARRDPLTTPTPAPRGPAPALAPAGNDP